MTAAPSPPPDAKAAEIFSRARAALVARIYPAEMAYSVRVSGLMGGTWTARTYETFERWPGGRVIARTISDEETSNPSHPSGSNVDLLFFHVGGTDEKLKAVVGEPSLGITYAFGLVPPPASLPLPGDVPTPEPGAPRVIGSVTALARTYDVRLAGEASVNGTTCWHLTLTPIGNPGEYRVRDMYVDEATDQTVRLRTDGNFTTKATGKGLWTVDYAQVDGSWYLSDEVSDGPVDADDGTYDKVDVRFVGVHPDLHENLDFGFGSPDDEPVLTEP